MLELLPFNVGHQFACRKAKLGLLLLLNNIVNELIEACHNFLNKNYSAFDAQVGDTSCQVRAYKICLLAMDNDYIYLVYKILPQLYSYKTHVENLIIEFNQKITLNPSYTKELDKSEKLEIYFQANNLDFNLDDNVKFILLSFFLKKYSLVDLEDIPNAINYKLIKEKFNIGSTPARSLANHYQSFLSKLSCKFIFELLDFYNISDGNNYLLKKLLKVGDRQRLSLPYYNITKILIYSSLTSSLPILFSITRIQENEQHHHLLLFKKEESTGKFKFIKNKEEYTRNTPCIIFRGCVEYKINIFDSIIIYLNQLISLFPELIILMNAASHPQYAGERLSSYRISPYNDLQISVDSDLLPYINKMEHELENKRTLSNSMGCSKENQTFFYIKHIFCDLIKNEYQIWNSSKLGSGSAIVGNQLMKPVTEDMNQTYRIK